MGPKFEACPRCGMRKLVDDDTHECPELDDATREWFEARRAATFGEPDPKPKRGGARPGAGRPPFPEGAARKRRIPIFVNDDEHAAWTKAALAAGETVAEWVRNAANEKARRAGVRRVLTERNVPRPDPTEID